MGVADIRAAAVHGSPARRRVPCSSDGETHTLPAIPPHDMSRSLRRSLTDSPVYFIVAMLLVGACAVVATLVALALLPALSHTLAAVIGGVLGPIFTAPIMWRLVVRPMREEVAREALRFSSLLEQRNKDLAAGLAEVSARESVLRRLSDMGEMLQSCASEVEAVQVVTRFCEQLLPGSTGALYSRSDGHEGLARLASWGPRADTIVAHFDAANCWAMRRGRMHIARECSARIDCEHALATLGETQVCVPLVAQGETLGVLHVAFREEETEEASQQRLRHMQHRQRLLGSVAEQSGLAIANLRAREVLRSQSIRDPLTGLFNRRFMDEWVERELQRAMRAGGTMSLVLLDLDHFKRINDGYGHDAGDAVLREVARVLQEQVRAGDVACRFGGEEFAVVIPSTGSVEAAAFAERLRRLLASHAISVRSQRGVHVTVRVTVSAGVATFPMHAHDVSALVRGADVALYDAKSRGRNRVCVRDGLTSGGRLGSGHADASSDATAGAPETAAAATARPA